MTKHIHIHLNSAPTKDAGWQENKHPRRDDGKFGSGAGQRHVGPSGRSFGTRGALLQESKNTLRKLESKKPASAAYAENAAAVESLMKDVGDGERHVHALRRAIEHLNGGADVDPKAKPEQLVKQLRKLLDEHKAEGAESKDWGYAGDLGHVRAILRESIDEFGKTPKPNPLYDRTAAGKKPGSVTTAALIKHSMYSKEDHAYLKGKGWSNEEILARWDAEAGNGNNKPVTKPKPDLGGFSTRYFKKA